MDNAYYFSMRTGQEAACMERGVDYKYIPYSLLEPCLLYTSRCV